MATKKAEVKKKAVKKKAVVAAAVATASPEAVAAVVKDVAPKKRKRIYTKKRLTALLDQMLTQFADQLTVKALTYSAGDGLKMMQMRENAEPERPTEVKVGWVEEPRP